MAIKFLLLVALIVMTSMDSVLAATFNIPDGDVSALINAINFSNSNDEVDIINLAVNGNYTITTINYVSANAGTSGFEGERGLPNILDDVLGLDLTINGNGASIQRDLSSPSFGLFSCKGFTVFNDVILRNAKVNAQGAALFIQFKGHVELNNCKFFNNESLLDTGGGGGAIYTKSLSELKLENCLFENNKAVNYGGAISNLLSDMTIINCTFISNEITSLDGMGPSFPVAGGAIFSDGARGDNGSLIVVNSTFEDNHCPQGQGGGMFLFPYNNISVKVTDCFFNGNTAGSGAGFWHDGGTVEIPDNEFPFTDIPASHTLEFHSNSFENNLAETQGGGLWIRRGLIGEIYDCTFKNNFANNGATGLGGAIFLRTEENVVIRNCTLHGNNARIAGGISFNHQSSTARVINCTFEGNTADAFGGAVAVPENDASRKVLFTNCTFANNEGNNPTNGQSGAIHSPTGGIGVSNSSVTITNCLFYNQTVTNPWNLWKNCNAQLVDGGNNLFYPENTGGRCVASKGTNIFDQDPLLDPLADNGGFTQTMAIQSGSPAIDKGTNNDCPATDQRGINRDGNCDIGAYEANIALPVSLTKFTARLLLNEIILAWQTSSEKNNSGFEIEHSLNGEYWVKLGFVKGNSTTNVPQTYTFSDKHPRQGINYYRLKQIDFDNRFEYSPVVFIDYQSTSNNKNISLYPNPFNDELNIEIPEKQLENVKVLNTLGRDVTFMVGLNHLRINNRLLMDTSRLPSGWYIIQFGTISYKAFKQNE